MTVRPGNPILFILAVALIVATSAVNDKRSCERSAAVRQASRAYFNGVADRSLQRAAVETGRAQRLDWQAYHAARHAALVVHPLDCSLPLPDTH